MGWSTLNCMVDLSKSFHIANCMRESQSYTYDKFSDPCVKGLSQRVLPPFLAFSRSFIITTR